MNNCFNCPCKEWFYESNGPCNIADDLGNTRKCNKRDSYPDGKPLGPRIKFNYKTKEYDEII